MLGAVKPLSKARKRPPRGRPLSLCWLECDAGLLAALIKDRFWPLDNLEIGRDCEKRRIRLGPNDVRQPEHLLSHARVASLAIDNRLEFRRGPNLGYDVERLLIADLAGRNGARGAHTIGENALYRLRAELLGFCFGVVAQQDRFLEGHRGC